MLPPCKNVSSCQKGGINITKFSDNYNRAYLAEIYDQAITYTADVELLMSLLGNDSLNILEVFCGTGRILVRLLELGHTLTGIEIAPAMAARAEQKATRLGSSTRQRLTLKVQDVHKGDGSICTEYLNRGRARINRIMTYRE